MNFELNSLLKKFNDKYGNKIGIASEISSLEIPRLESGIDVLDLAVGGGFPIGRISMLWGPRSGGKTSTCTKLMASAQRTCRHCYSRKAPDGTTSCSGHSFEGMVCFFADVEGTYDLKWSEKLGVDNSKVLYCQPESGEEAGDVVDGMVRVEGVDLIILDSIAAMIPTKEAEDEMEAQSIGLQARLVNKVMRKLVSGLNGTTGPKKTVLLTNQVRQKAGLVFGDPEVMPGGKGQEFVTSVEVKFRMSKPILQGSEELPVAVTSSFVVKKNKTSVAGMEGDYMMWLRDVPGHKPGDINNGEFLSYWGEKYTLVEKKGGSYKFGDIDLGRNKDELQTRLDTDLVVAAKLKRSIFYHVLGRTKPVKEEGQGGTN